jgi:L-rhamnose mutarotase
MKGPPMFRTAMTFQLKPGCYDQYKRAHDEIWPDIAASMADNDVSMAIYHYRGRLFMFAVAPSETHWDRSLADRALARWHAHIATMMVTDTDGRSVVEDMDEAFVFGMFK